MSCKIVLIILSALCISRTFAARFNVVGSQNQDQVCLK